MEEYCNVMVECKVCKREELQKQVARRVQSIVTHINQQLHLFQPAGRTSLYLLSGTLTG